MTPTVSVVICTYNRPRMLQAAVESCIRDATRRDLPFEIVIADNSPDGHAVPLVEKLAGSAVPVRRVAAHPPNISIARNAGLRGAQAPLVAFMDDDLQLHAGWLDAFVETMNATGADAAVGPVLADFPGGAPSWDPEGSRFTRVLPRRSGDKIPVNRRERPPNFAISTASSIWRVATCFTDPEPFDPKFGGVGGEDYDLFVRLERRGRRIVWCAEAGVCETIPEERTTFVNQLMRTYSGGQAFAAVMIKNTDHPIVMGMDVMVRGAVQALLPALKLIPLAAMTLLGRKQAGLRLHHEVLAVTSAVGKVMWWRKLRYYHVERPSVSA